jgi:hypothetical protein
MKNIHLLPTEEQKQHIIDIMKADEELGLYEENKKEGFIEGYNHSQYSHPHSDDDMIEFASFCFDAVGDISGKYINKTNQELLEIWKEERIKTIYYE